MLSRIPMPPTDMTMPWGAQALFTIGQFIPFIVFTIIAFRLWRREGTLIPILCMIGGGFAMFMEPVVDVLGLVWFPREGQWRLFEVFGRPIPLFIVVYFWYVGGQAFLSWRKFERGVTAHDIWRMYGIYMVINVILETPGLLMGVYTYYGKQPFNFWGLPLWWPFINAGMPIVAAAIIYRLRPYLQGWRILGVIPLIPMADGLVNGAAGWPTWVALNTRLPAVVTWSAGVVSMALGVFVMWIVTLVVVPRPAPVVREPALVPGMAPAS